MSTARNHGFAHFGSRRRTPEPRPAAAWPLHRIADVRQAQGISMRTLARRMSLSPAQLIEQEQSTCDLTLSELYHWQEALNVPMADLLQEPSAGLSGCVRDRAVMIRIMRTVRSLQEHPENEQVRYCVETLANQLIELMPELVHVDSWPTVGRRRSLDEISPLEERAVSSRFLDGHSSSAAEAPEGPIE